MIEVILLTAERVLFQGQVQRAVFPGEQGTFEVGPFHRPFFSRLLPGLVVVDEQMFPILRGVVKVQSDAVQAIVELIPGNG